jgi:phosphate transport system substrate-binding protein
MEDQTKSRLKLIISGLLGLGITVLSLFVLLLLLFLPERSILFPLLCVSYISIIIFLILWNKKKTKIVYFLLCIPVACIAAGIITVEYNYRIRKNIPAVSEDIYYLYDYIPFEDENILAKLDEDSNFKIADNLPVLDGATALYPVYASFAQAVYPESEYDTLKGPVLCSRTDRAYTNLLEGKVDIIFCAEPSEAQLQQFTDNASN